ncbi:MAG: tyrosine-protein kinase [Actinomycetota bacterium]|nr:tyrosine-protein kinase [Actinomycetota bacterium]
MDLQEYLRVIRRRWMSVLGITLVVVGIAAGYTLLAPKIYDASAEGFVALGPTNTSAPVASAALGLQRVKTYTRFVNAPAVLNEVIKELNLTISTQQLAGMVTATNPPQTLSLIVTAAGTDPVQTTRIANAVLTQLGKQVEILETPPGAAQSAVKFSVTTPASVPTSPTSPNVPINLALGLVLGLGLGIAVAVLRHVLDTTVKSDDDLRQISGSTTLGIIPFEANASTSLATKSTKSSIRGEAYRTIRTNVQFVDVDNPPRAIVVTSSVPGEGKTTTAANLAVAMAEAGLRVCLLEADLRRPKVADYLGIAAGAGITDILRGTHTIEEVTVSWGRDLLSVIGAGTIPPNPSEILASHQMAALVQELLESYDSIILATPPLLLVTDAAALTPATDGALLIVKYGSTSREQVRKSREALEATGARLLGTALNCVPAKSYGYGYGYRSGYGYGYGYGSGERKSPAADGDSDSVVEVTGIRPAAATTREAPDSSPR